MERGTGRMEEALQKKQNHGGRENECESTWESGAAEEVDWK